MCVLNESQVSKCGLQNHRKSFVFICFHMKNYLKWKWRWNISWIHEIIDSILSNRPRSCLLLSDSFACLTNAFEWNALFFRSLCSFNGIFRIQSMISEYRIKYESKHTFYCWIKVVLFLTTIFLCLRVLSTSQPEPEGCIHFRAFNYCVLNEAHIFSKLSRHSILVIFRQTFPLL